MKILLLIAAVGGLAFQAGMGEPSDSARVRAKLEAIPMNVKVHLSEDEWRKILTPEQYAVLRERGTERPSLGSCLNPHQTGTFVCAACGNPLFGSGEKFESGTGWPSFAQAMAADHITITRDARHGMVRDEVSCARCDSHLGHVFPDGPPPTGLRYCMNSVALRLVQTETATFAAGCFWGVQSAFDQTHGVLKTTAGYTGGHVPNPTYEQVCSHTTGHAEAVQVEFDPAKTSYSQLLDLFWKIHNPRQKGGQGPDIGDNYRSAIFTHTPEQKAAAEASKAAQSAPGKPAVVTEIVEAGPFYPAEAYHQHYKSASCGLPR